MNDLKEILAAATPGPWNASPSIPEDGYECFWIRARKPMGLATRGFSVVNIGAADGPQDTTRKANARLIAMAPDLAAEVLRLRAEVERLTEAMTPSRDTKAAYMGEIHCDCPTENWKHFVPWTSIKEIMAMIRARAALKGTE